MTTRYDQGMSRLAMRSAGAMAALNSQVDEIERALARLDRWQPAHALLAETQWVRGALANMTNTWGSKLVVVLVGPSGAGKSSLLNALAEEDVSATGLQRPTTQDVVVYCQHEVDAQTITQDVGADRVHVHTAPTARGLDHLLLVDTPDTNTTPQNQALLGRVLERADVALAVLSAQNPKLYDNLAFLAPYVNRLAPGAVVVALNRVDRVARDELLNDVLPDLRTALEEAWATPVSELYLTCARSVVQAPVDERPLHEINQLDALRRFLYGELNRAEQVVDRRLSHAEHLVDGLCEHGAQEAARAAAPAAEAARLLDDFASEAGGAVQGALGRTETVAQASGDGLLLYGQMAQRAWGPVGWLVTMWAALLRIGGALGGLVGRGGRNQAGSGMTVERATLAQEAFALTCAESWPGVSAALARAGFDRQMARSETWQQALEEESQTWQAFIAEEALARIAVLSHRLTVWPLQLLLNAPALGMAGYVCYDTVSSFIMRQWLPAGYFEQAGLALLTLWGLGFVAMQALVAASLRRLRKRALPRAVVDRLIAGVTRGISAQIEAIGDLETICRRSE